jgi:hypothetical protein
VTVEVVELYLIPCNEPRPRAKLIVRRHGTRPTVPVDFSRRSSRPRQTCPTHFFRKGYYLGVPADYVCVICGERASKYEVDGEDDRDT